MACVNMNNAANAFNSNGNSSATENNQPNAPGYFEAMDAASQAQLDATMKAREDAKNTINGAFRNSTSTTVNPIPSAQARAAARALYAKTAKDGINKLKAKADDLFHRLYGVNSLGRFNIGMKISTKLSSIFKNKMATLESFMIGESPFEQGQNVGSHAGVEAWRGIDRKAIGFMRDFNTTYFDPFIKGIETRAHELGFEGPMAFARAIGDYAVMRHMPEANAYWLQNKQRDLIQAIADKDVQAVNRLQHEIDHFLQYRDWTGQVDENGAGIKCAGRTDGFAAEWIDNFHRQYKIDRAEMEGYAQQLSNIVTELNKWNIAQGNVPLEDAAAIGSTGFQRYVPLKAARDLSSTLPTDSTIMNAGNFHSREGMDSRTPIANAFDSIYHHAQRIAQDNASRDAVLSLVALKYNALRQGRESPIEVNDYNTAVAKANAGGSFGAIYRNIIEGKNGFMATAMVPERTADGRLTVKRKIVTFDDNYVNEGTGITGKQLNESVKAVQQDTMLKLASRATGFLGSLNTHYNIAFPAVNAVKDAGERLNNLFGQTYRMENGSYISGDHFAGAYVAAIPKAMSFLSHILTGKVPDLDASPIGRYWKEYVTQGIKQEFDPTRFKEGAELETVLGQLKKDKTAGPMLELLGRVDDATRKKILNGIHNWNDYFNNVSAFAQFLALREKGVDIDSASTGTLEVINLRESGSATPWMRAWYAFAKPTMQGAASLLRSIGLSPNAAGQFKPSVKGMAFLAAQGIVSTIAYNIYKSAVGSEQADNVSLDNLSRYVYLPIGKDGDSYKLPIPFGASSIGAAAFIGLDRVMRGAMEPLDYVGHMVRQVFKATTPAEFPAYAMSDGFATYMMGLFSPSALQPIMQVVANKGYFGQNITYGDANSTTPMYMQGKATTPSGWGSFAKLLNHYSGGLINAAPEQVKTLIEGYFGGISQIFPDLINRNSLASMGFDETTQGKLGTAMSVLGASMLYNKLPMTHTRQYYTEYDKLKKEIRDMGIKLSEKGAYSDAEEREIVWRDKLAAGGMDAEKIEKYLALYCAEQDKNKLTEEFKEKTTNNPNFPDMEEDDMRALFEDYMNKCEEIYVQGLRL